MASVHVMDVLTTTQKESLLLVVLDLCEHVFVCSEL